MHNAFTILYAGIFLSVITLWGRTKCHNTANLTLLRSQNTHYVSLRFGTLRVTEILSVLYNILIYNS